jgi:thiosulfate/3-mercaptopyruvate sulfurtransferase
MEPGGTELHHLLAPAQRCADLLSLLGVNRGSRVVLYDGGEGYTASRLFWILDYFGHPNAAVLNGGFRAWRTCGGALTGSETVHRRGDFVPRPDPAKIADYAAVRAALGSVTTVLVNTLSAASYRKESIPGSINIPYTSIYRKRGADRLLDPGKLDELLREFGISTEQDVILFCGIGYTASQIYTAARALGRSGVRLYDGSLAEWKARGGDLSPGRSIGPEFRRVR